MLIEPPLLTKGANLLRVVFHPNGVRRWIVNWDEICRHQLARAERDFGAPLDEAGVQLLQELRGYAGSIETPAARASPCDLLLPIHIRRGDIELRLFSTIMTLGTPQDAMLQEIRVESFHPADTSTASAAPVPGSRSPAGRSGG